MSPSRDAIGVQRRAERDDAADSVGVGHGESDRNQRTERMCPDHHRLDDAQLVER